MTPIGSTSSNIRRAIEFMVDSSFSPRRSKQTLTITWTTAHRETHRTTQRRLMLTSRARWPARRGPRNPDIVAAMPYEEIDGVPIWYEEHGDADGPPLVALHGGILTFEGSFGDVLSWLRPGRRVIGVELQGHGHTADTGRPMSVDQFADDVAELLDRLGIERADFWGFSLGALTATGVAIRPPAKVRRLVLAAINIRP